MKGSGFEEIFSDTSERSGAYPLPSSSTHEDILNRAKAYGEKFSPSAEQIGIIQAALTGGDIKVQAFAGTGKTTTIRLLTQALQKRSLYVAFNRDIVKSVTNLVNTHASTAHSLAFRETVGTNANYQKKHDDGNRQWSNKTLKNTLNTSLQPTEYPIIKGMVKAFIKSIDAEITIAHIAPEVIDVLEKSIVSTKESVEAMLCEMAELSRASQRPNSDEQFIEKSFQDVQYKKPIEALNAVFTKREQRDLIDKIVKNASSYSTGNTITVEDFPSPEYKKLAALGTESKQDKIDILISRWVELARIFWESVIDPSTNTPLDHDSYFKLWQLQKPKLDFDIIYIDEAQDLDPVMLDVLQNQNCQKIWLGDEYQQIYEWRGAVNALSLIDCQYQLFLTETFRFPPTIAAAANRVLAKLESPKKIVTHVKEASSRPREKFVFIARTNKSLFSTALKLAEKEQTFYWKKFNLDSLLWNCRQVVRLATDQKASGSYEDFSSYHELKEHLETHSSDDMKRAVELCERYQFDLPKIAIALDDIKKFNHPTARYQLISAHQSKGQEWDYVLLSDDFNDVKLKPNGELDKAEWNILYVAITRAMQSLQLYSPTIATLFDSQAAASARLSENEQVMSSVAFELPSPDLFYDKSSRKLYKRMLEENIKAPIIGYDCEENSRVIGTLEFAWPERKVGVYLVDEPVKPANWIVFSIEELESDLAKLKLALTA